MGLMTDTGVDNLSTPLKKGYFRKSISREMVVGLIYLFEVLLNEVYWKQIPI